MRVLSLDNLNHLLASEGFEIYSFKVIQNLWKGYGQIVRLQFETGPAKSAILKLIKLPFDVEEDLSHQRKVKSYQIEWAWYSQASGLCDAFCRVPQAYAQGQGSDSHWLLLEDLDAAGYRDRKRRLNHDDMLLVLSWLAHFHCRFLGYAAPDLWEQGTYWHLDTRPDEWNALPEGHLKQVASLIDQKLKACKYQTLLHGDAKPANFCFGPESIAAVDFQYVGRGCAMKDLAYFLSACLPESYCFSQVPIYLDQYFEFFHQALEQPEQAIVIESEWRELFPWAWCDFYRFERGWHGGFASEAPYSESLLKQILQN